MSLFTDFVKSKTPKFNEILCEGLTYHRIEKSIESVDNFYKFACFARTQTHMRYLGYRVLNGKETMQMVFKKKTTYPYDISKSNLFLVEYQFRYADEPEMRVKYMWLPFMKRSNIFTLNDKDLLVMPVLANKVISIGEKGIHASTLTGKYNFSRLQYSVRENGINKFISVVVTELYKGQPKHFPDSTKAKATIIHYLLACYGFSETMRRLLGFVPTPTYAEEWGEDQILVSSTGIKPKPWANGCNMFVPNKISFLVDVDKYDPYVLYILGNVLYVLDYFYGKMENNISLSELDDPDLWRPFVGEITHTIHYGLAQLRDLMGPHFNDLQQPFDISVVKKIEELAKELPGKDIYADSIMTLLEVIAKNFNQWIASGGNGNLYANKSLEVESYVLEPITSNILRMFLTLSKDELRNGGMPLEPKFVDKIMKDNLKEKSILRIRSNKQIVAYVEDSTPHSYFKKVAFIVIQESDFTNPANGQTNTSFKQNLNASMAVVCSFLYLKKSNPIPSRLNVYLGFNMETGSIVPHPDVVDIVNRTQELIEYGQIDLSVSSDFVDDGTPEPFNMDDDDDYIPCLDGDDD